MAKKVENEEGTELLALAERADKGLIIQKALQSRVRSLVKKASVSRNDYGLDALLKDPFYEDGKPRFSEGAYNALPESEKNEYRDIAFGARLNRSLSDGVNMLSSKLEDLVDDKEIGKGLIKIASKKPILENASQKDAELLGAYAGFVSYASLVDNLSDGKKIDPELNDQLRKAASNAAVIRARNDYLGKGYRQDDADLFSRLAAFAPSEVVDTKQLAEGAKKEVATIKEDLKKRFGEDYEDKVIGAVSGSLKTMLASGDEQVELNALSLYLESQRGYGLGTRKYSEAFKK